MKTVETLPQATFSGRRFTRKQLAQVQATVQTFLNLSRKELARTLCEHLSWTTPNGQYKVHSCLTLLDKLEAHGVVTLSAKRIKKTPGHPIPAFHEPPARKPKRSSIACTPVEPLPRRNHGPIGRKPDGIIEISRGKMRRFPEATPDLPLRWSIREIGFNEN